MFVFNRSALAVLAPLALLIAVVLFSKLADGPQPAAPVRAAQPQPAAVKGTVARNEPGRPAQGS